jgi:NAD(P)H dehydrogenase (quinone)
MFSETVRDTPRSVFLLLTWLALGTSLASGQDAANRAPDPEPSPVRILVAYYSLRGTTEQMAQAVAEGAREVPGATVLVRKIPEVTKEELQAADGIVLGSPAYFANIAGTAKLAIDDWNWKLKVDFTDKVGGAFATGGGQTGGKEHVVVSLLLFMLNNRMVVAGPLYQDEEGEDQWGELGATAMTGPLDPGVSAQERDAARRLGRRVARLAVRMRAH